MKALDAYLHHLQIQSPEPVALARFYKSAMDMTCDRTDDGQLRCCGPDRLMLITDGQAGQLGFAAWALADVQQLEEMKRRLQALNVNLLPSPSPLFKQNAFSILDPDANHIVFGVRPDSSAGALSSASSALPGRLQHVVMGSTQSETIVSFYSDVLGFRISDKVYTDEGLLTACFLRSDAEHHSFAVFRTSKILFEHHSYEVGEWNLIRDWADKFSKANVPIEWGPGRHGPGNNLFFFVRDPDGNSLEFSAELELCASDRTPGQWAHEEHTLNAWGRGVLRS
jgi:catechol 2,3-dioxygenase